MLFIVFPADEKVKVRLDEVCNLLNISLEEWFETALKASEFQTSWMWDEYLCQYVSRSEVD